jgi:hypothetical protein
VQIVLEMSMALLLDSTPMKETLVCIQTLFRFFDANTRPDIVGNNIPVFFIQDAILFPDLIHAVKPSPEKEIPQAATAHDSAWDFFSQQPSALHTLFWAMSGNGIPRSYRHMDGFGIHTFRFVTSDGNSKFVKFHFKTKQGKASLVWEEAQVLAGKNADYHRDDLWEAIESGNGPEWEFGVQIFDEKLAATFSFDVLDPVSHNSISTDSDFNQCVLDKDCSRGAGSCHAAWIVEIKPEPTKLLCRDRAGYGKVCCQNLCNKC